MYFKIKKNNMMVKKLIIRKKASYEYEVIPKRLSYGSF